MDIIMNMKQLKLNVDKSAFVLFGRKNKVEEIRQFIADNPLMLSGQVMKEKVHEKYLGEHMHGEGLEKTIEFTVQQRHWITVSAIMEIKTILNDLRSHVPGGLNTGILLWEMAVIPMLTNNGCTWNDISDETLKKLEDLQHMLIRYLFDTPRTSPLASLCFDTGMLKMKQRLMEKQINLVFHLSTLDDKSLGKQVYDEQVKYSLPGLVTDVQKHLKKLGIPSI